MKKGKKRITTDMQVKAIKLLEGQNKRKDTVGDGLYLLTNKSGKYWRYDYKYDGKIKTYSIGTYPAVLLVDAKLSLSEPKLLLKEGIDPNQAKKEARQVNKLKAREIEAQEIEEEEQAVIAATTLKVVGEEWFETACLKWATSHANKQHQRMNKHLYPQLGHIPISELKRQQIVDAMLLICETSSPDIGRRISQICRQILNYACNRGLIEYAPMGDLKGVLPPVVSNKLPCIAEPKRLSEYMQAIFSDEHGTYAVSMAMKIFPYMGVRCGEFRLAQWCEVDLVNAVWTIPASHRKLSKAKKESLENTHIIPLSNQAIELLIQLQRVTGHGKHIFPSVRGDSRSMSEATLNKRIAWLGFKGEMVAHSWRTVYSTYMNETNHNPDAIERHLAHEDKNKVRMAYNRADYMEQRTIMIQTFGDWLDGLRDGATVIPIKRKA